jgi:UPF0755 protein
MVIYKQQQFLKYVLPLVIAIVFIVSTLLYQLVLPVSLSAAEAVVITVKPGMTTQQIGDLLYDQGLIKNVYLFRAIARSEGLESSLQAGDYAVSKSMSVREIVVMLAKGETAYKQFTIPEGYTVDQIANLLQSKGIASAAKFKAYAASYAPYEFMNSSTSATYKAEGFLFPDTYRITAGASEEQLVKMMVSQFNDRFTPEMRQRASELDLSLRDVIIMASLVEKEARVEKDRPVIAGVFRNRLKMGMPLQSCATIQYILGYPKPALSIQDTELPSPYNTYQNSGLPPGPIANPGMAAIKAVLYPADTDYLYFVADKNGAHVFSKTYEEHLAAIEQVSK